MHSDSARISFGFNATWRGLVDTPGRGAGVRVNQSGWPGQSAALICWRARRKVKSFFRNGSNG
jgi:hypothetical protein